MPPRPVDARCASSCKRGFPERVPEQAFTTKFEMRSPRYTTRWDELPKVL
ncbi:DUF4113 domain-containing protein [Devosia sp. A449]